jgi:hypothetical protein
MAVRWVWCCWLVSVLKVFVTGFVVHPGHVLAQPPTIIVGTTIEVEPDSGPGAAPKQQGAARLH